MRTNMQTFIHQFTSKQVRSLLPVKPRTYTGRYAMHRYWARKPYNIVARFIEHFTNEGDIVLDPFCGSGVTAIESLILRRKAIAVDLDPTAVFITRNTGMPINLSEFLNAFKVLEEKVKNGINSLYYTSCPDCQGEAIILHTIWKDERPIKIRFKCMSCRNEGKKEISQQDMITLKKIEKADIPYWYPSDELIENSRINVYKGMHVSDLFTKRNLFALSLLWNEIQNLSFSKEVKDLMKFVFTGALSQASKMVFVIRRRGRIRGKTKQNATENEEVGSRVIGYWIPSEHFEINVWNCFENRFKKVLAGKKQTNELIGNYYREGKCFEDLIKEDKTILIFNRSVTDLSFLPQESVDYVFTDPPYGDQVPYFELDALWASWLRSPINYDDEIVISDSPARNKGFQQYRERLARAFNEIYRVLKPGRFMSVCFYNYNLKIWHALISSCIDAGFEKFNILPISASHPSIVQLSRPGGSRGALVITFKKPIERETSPRKAETPINIEKIVIDMTSKLILEKGGATTYEIYDNIITALIDNNALDKEADILKILKRNFKIIEGKWVLNNLTSN